MAEVSVDQRIAASPDDLYGMVSDVTRMGEWSPETTSCRWLGGATGPAVGARFRGANRIGWRRWSTTCRVVAADPGREFAFTVHAGPVPVARWSYRFTGDGDGGQVTESWVDQRPGWMVLLSPAATGVHDRAAHNHRTMADTLDRLRRHAEGSTAPAGG